MQELGAMALMTMQTINVCGIVYIGSKIFGFISIVTKFMLREVERSGQGIGYCKKDNLEDL